MGDNDNKDLRSLRQKEKFVLKQIFTSGFVTSATFFFSFRYAPFDTSGLISIGDRMAFAIRCLFFSSLSIYFFILKVGNLRFYSNAIDPIKGGGEEVVDIANRVLRNTVEQFITHSVGLLTLSTLLDASSLKAIPILVGLFLLGRVVFWKGYTSSSALNRGYGFAATNLPTIAVYIYCLFSFVRLYVV
ncbi:transmembrane protein 79-like [Saccostrea echinata]|uniref:transmembrane protein 79-like n=1 Tax=Saccostrea echinata TaxID=191078 RepID=UPI002A8142E1|nr:transmembrane protein 79-like [Saccostrea echinata]